jgi:hypothetical protein
MSTLTTPTSADYYDVPPPPAGARDVRAELLAAATQEDGAEVRVGAHHVTLMYDAIAARKDDIGWSACCSCSNWSSHNVAWYHRSVQHGVVVDHGLDAAVSAAAGHVAEAVRIEHLERLVDRLGDTVERLRRVEFVLRNVATAADFIDHGRD